MALESGSRLGVYEILEPIGAGGMGQVFQARDNVGRPSILLKSITTAGGSVDRYHLLRARLV
jgi:hypothetical protein